MPTGPRLGDRRRLRGDSCCAGGPSRGIYADRRKHRARCRYRGGRRAHGCRRRGTPGARVRPAGTPPPSRYRAQRTERPWSVPGVLPQPRSIRPGYSVASVPNCSAIVSGAWLGSMIPPAPRRIVSCGQRRARSGRLSPTTRSTPCCGARRTRPAGNRVSRPLVEATLASSASRDARALTDDGEIEDRERSRDVPGIPRRTVPGMRSFHCRAEEPVRGRSPRLAEAGPGAQTVRSATDVLAPFVVREVAVRGAHAARRSAPGRSTGAAHLGRSSPRSRLASGEIATPTDVIGIDTPIWRRVATSKSRSVESRPPVTRVRPSPVNRIAA